MSTDESTSVTDKIYSNDALESKIEENIENTSHVP